MNEHGPTLTPPPPAPAGDAGGRGEDPLNALLRRHLAEALDQLAGRTATLTFPPRRPAPMRLPWGTSALAAAACLLLAVALWATLAAAPPAARQRPLVIAPAIQDAPDAHAAAEPEVLRSVAWRTTDEGIVYLGEEREPARQLRRHIIEYSHVFDPVRRTTVELAVPREEVVFVGLARQ